MTELNITALFSALVSKPLGGGNAVHYSGSVAELGPDAGLITWENCLRDGTTLLGTKTDAKIGWDELHDAIRDYAESFGAWDRPVIDSWLSINLYAFLLQDIASAVREWDAVTGSEDGWTGDWDMYREAAEAGRVSGRLSVGRTEDPSGACREVVFYSFGA
jgi:hypothetical protein